MPDSDDDYVQDHSDDNAGTHDRVSRGTQVKSLRVPASAARGGEGASGGFEVSRTWENVVEGEDGTITGGLEGMLEAGKRRRCVLQSPLVAL